MSSDHVVDDSILHSQVPLPEENLEVRPTGLLSLPTETMDQIARLLIGHCNDQTTEHMLNSQLYSDALSDWIIDGSTGRPCTTQERTQLCRTAAVLNACDFETERVVFGSAAIQAFSKTCRRMRAVAIELAVELAKEHGRLKVTMYPKPQRAHVGPAGVYRGSFDAYIRDVYITFWPFADPLAADEDIYAPDHSDSYQIIQLCCGLRHLSSIHLKGASLDIFRAFAEKDQTRLLVKTAIFEKYAPTRAWGTPEDLAQFDKLVEDRFPLLHGPHVLRSYGVYASILLV